MAAQRLVRRLPVGESVVEAILTLVRSGRPDATAIEGARRFVAWGPGPRASQALMLACRARALIEAALRRRSTTSSRWRRRSCGIAWRSASPAAPRASTVARVIEQMAAPLALSLDADRLARRG